MPANPNTPLSAETLAEADRWLTGEAWTQSHIPTHARTLCQDIGPRWASTPAERRTVEYIHRQFDTAGLDAAIEDFTLSTWSHGAVALQIEADDTQLDAVPFNFCPPCDLKAPLLDAGYGTAHQRRALGDRVHGAAAVLALAHEPFSTPEPLGDRIAALVDQGAAAVLVIDSKTGRRAEYHNAGDWRDPEPEPTAVPTVTTSREHGALLRQANGQTVHLRVESRFYEAPAANVHARLAGTAWPDEHLLLGGHHDTVYGAPGGNDNASGTIAVLETARILAGLRQATGIAPGRSLHFATFSAEEQKFQGAYEYVRRHYGPDAAPPRLAINLDELAAGHIKGVVLAFDHLRDTVQAQLDAMGDGLRCHVMSQLDTSSDHFPFLRAGIDAAHLWRWRFHGRHADSDFHHEAADTADKLNLRELKEYAAQLARLLLRLSHLPPDQWPTNPVTVQQVAQRLEAERGSVVRVY